LTRARDCSGGDDRSSVLPLASAAQFGGVGGRAGDVDPHLIESSR
jgi:hypothetical protein